MLFLVVTRTCLASPFFSFFVFFLSSSHSRSVLQDLSLRHESPAAAVSNDLFVISPLAHTVLVLHAVVVVSFSQLSGSSEGEGGLVGSGGGG